MKDSRKLMKVDLKFAYCFGVFICLLGLVDVIILNIDVNEEISTVFSNLAEMFTIMGIGLTILTIADSSIVQSKANKSTKELIEAVNRVEQMLIGMEDSTTKQNGKIHAIQASVKDIKNIQNRQRSK